MTAMARNLAVSAVIVSSFVFVGAVEAQTQTGQINGTVKARNGADLPGVTVTLTGSGVMGTKTTVTEASGNFRFPSLLPAADYSLAFDLEGFNRTVREGIQVSAGQTVTLPVVMDLPTVTEEITVAQSPMVSVTSPTASTSQGAELLEAIPNTRQFQDAVSRSPSLVGGGDAGTWSSKGGAATSNEVAFDGVANTSPIFHTIQQSLVYESVAEVQVVTGALPAELGNVGGAFVNVVTKSGGNQFRGEVSAFYQDESLQSDNLDDPLREQGIESAAEIKDFDDQAFNVGGPIVRDQAWFNVAFRNYLRADSLSGFPEVNEDEREYWIGKVTLQPSEKHNLFVMYNHNEGSLLYNPANEFNSPEATWFYPSESDLYKAKWMMVLNSNAYLETDLSQTEDEIGYVPQRDSTGVSYYDAITLQWTGAAYLYGGNQTRRRYARVAVPWYVDDWGGSHDFKGGIEYENLNYTSDNVKDSEVYYHYTYAGYPLFAVFSNYPKHTVQESDGVHAFIQDNWRVTDRVTLSLGVRGNTWDGIYPAQGDTGPGRTYGPYVQFAPVHIDDTTSIDWKVLEPRVGATISLDEAGKSVLRAAYSQYHHGLYFGYLILGNPNALGYTINVWTDLDGDVFADPDEVGPVIASGGGVAALVDPDLENPVTDELMVGFESQILRDLSIGINATWREDDDLIEIVKPGLGPADFVPVDVPDPGADGVAGTGDDQVLHLFNQVSGFDVGQEVTNPPRADREYKGVELIARKRLTHKWQGLASLVWQEATGSMGNSFNASLGYSLDFDDPNKLINLNGPLDQDREWQAKVMGSYQAPLGFIFSGYWEFLTGYPLYRTLSANLNQGPEGPVPVVAEPRDTYRLDDLTRLDLRVEKVFTLGARPYEIGIILDAFNVFNENGVTVENGDTLGGGGFGRPVAIQLPRTLRVGARLSF
jgi:hypothetical protein